MGDDLSVNQKVLSHREYLQRLSDKQASLSSLVLYYEGTHSAIQFLGRVNKIPSKIY